MIPSMVKTRKAVDRVSG